MFASILIGEVKWNSICGQQIILKPMNTRVITEARCILWGVWGLLIKIISCLFFFPSLTTPLVLWGFSLEHYKSGLIRRGETLEHYRISWQFTKPLFKSVEFNKVISGYPDEQTTGCWELKSLLVPADQTWETSLHPLRPFSHLI